MRRIVLSFVIVTATLFIALPAHAQLTRTFVSSSGVDTNPCTIAAPCATFAHAYSLVASNGIVAALDPGKYGPLNITSPVTIDGNGWASITAPANGYGITIQAGSSDNIILRGITVDGGGGSSVLGIEFNSGASLTLTACTIRNIGIADGVDFYNNGSSLETLTVVDSQFLNNGLGNVSLGAGSGVVIAAESSGGITASFVRTEFSGNHDGLELAANGSGVVSVAATDSVVSANDGLAGIYVQAYAGPVNLVLTKDQIAGNAIGIFFEPTFNNAIPTVWLAQSTVAGNATAGFQINNVNGVLNSYGNNYFADNGSNTGSLTPVGTR